MALINFGAGLAAAGQSVANTAGAMALEQQKSALETQKIQLADQLAASREAAQSVRAGDPEKRAAAALNLRSAVGQYNALHDTNLDPDELVRLAGGSPAPAAPTTSPIATTTASPAQSPTAATSPTPTDATPSGSAAPPGGAVKAKNGWYTPEQVARAGLTVEDAKSLAANNPTVFEKVMEAALVPKTLRLGEIAAVPNGKGGQTNVLENRNRIEPFPSDPDARQALGLNPGDRGYLENGAPKIAHKDNPNAPFNEDGTRNQAFQDWEIGKAGKEAAAAANATKDIPQRAPAASQLSEDAKREAALYYIQNGKMPVSTRNRADSDAIMNYVASLKPQGVSDDDWVRGLQNNAIALHGKLQAAGTLTKQQAVTAVNEDTVVGAGNILNGLLKKGVAGPTDITDANAALQWLGRKFNNADDVNLQNAIQTYSNEYARVMTGATTGAPSSDSARAEAAKRLLNGYTAGTMQSAMKQMNQEMENRSASYKNALTQLTGGYGGVQPSATADTEINPQGLGNPANNGAAAIPPEARAKLKEGTVTTFGNNTKWTLQNGKPVQVQ